MSPELPQIIAHRGVRQEFPENTVAAIEEALTLSDLSGVEFDVELAADAPCVLHQETMVPDADFKKLIPATRDYTARDWVKQHSLDELQTLDAGSWFSSSCNQLKIPSLPEVLECKWKDRTAYMELKDPTYWSDQNVNHPRQIVQAVSSYVGTFQGSLEIISFNPEVLRESLHQFPDVPRIFALWFEWEEQIEKAFSIAEEVEASTLNLADKMLLKNKEWLTRARDLNIRLFVYPVSPTIGEADYEHWNAQNREKVWDELLELEPDGIISDFPRELLAYVSA